MTRGGTPGAILLLRSCFGPQLAPNLFRMEALNLVPKAGTANQVFAELATNFKLADEVKDALIRAKLENLDEFRFFFDEESKVEPWVNKLKLGEDQGVQAARVRRAWAAVRLYFQHLEQDRSKVVASDLDTMLDDTELRDKKVAFWRIYHLRFPAEIHPADATLSRVTREISKRMLCVYNIWKVRTLQFQLHTSSRKRKLGDNLFTEDKEEDDHTPQDWDSYLDKLHTLLIAYAMAGTSKLTLAAGSTVATFDTLGVDSAQHVETPLDIMMAYLYRAKRTSSALPPSKRLGWLTHRDTEERSEWVTKFRESRLTLGQVVRDTMAARDAHWLPTTATLSPENTITSEKDKRLTPAGANPSTSQFQLGKPINGRQVAKSMKDGSKLCQAFQHSQCKNKPPCPQGQHRCALVTKKERICGAAGHGAASCRNGQKG